jgi:hypothetical protein
LKLLLRVAKCDFLAQFRLVAGIMLGAGMGKLILLMSNGVAGGEEAERWTTMTMMIRSTYALLQSKYHLCTYCAVFEV